ncbi:MAG: FAD-dependent oxidoreductase, partial [Kiloniellales bacterium]|nr:FAD-dependent oxidoreductase [Kiloniellales bacterium]
MPDDQARIVIIGGGAIGCSIAYHLALAGESDVLLLEKSQLTHGSTWHAAGLVGQLRSKRNLTRLMQNSVKVFDRLKADTGQETEWKKVGSLRLAASDARFSEIKRTLTQAKSFGFEAHLISPSEAEALFPYIEKKGVVAAAYIPSDGQIDPYSLTQAYAKGARQRGIRLLEGRRVTGFQCEGSRITKVLTNDGTISCELVVNSAGLWAKEIGELISIPIASGVVEHQYMVSEKRIDIEDGLPTLRDPDANFYLKPDVKSFAIGGWEDVKKHVAERGGSLAPARREGPHYDDRWGRPPTVA